MKCKITCLKKITVSAAIMGIGFPMLVNAADETKILQNRLLNVVDSIGSVGAWNVDNCRANPAAGIEPRIGAVAVDIHGDAKHAGSKVDAPFFDGELPGCKSISVWAYVKPDSNAKDVGFQIKDAKGEWLMYVMPADWTGWKQVEADPSTAPFKQAYEQKDHDGKVDMPVTSIHIVWFAKDAGPTSLVFDALTAKSELRPGESGIRLNTIGGGVSDAGKPLDQHFIAENFDSAERNAEISYTLQNNPALNDSTPPDPSLGFDHALGCKNTWTVDGKDKGDAKMCDGDDASAVETPWGKDYKEAVVTVELGKLRELVAVTLQSGDANWIWKIDVSASEDGSSYKPVEGLQNYDLHGKWGRQNLPWPKQPVKAGFLKLRFHDNGKGNNCIRLPVSLMVYDGAGNDTLAVPKTGDVVASGKITAKVPANSFAEIALKGADPIAPGSYLLGLEVALNGRKEVRWSQYLVRPVDQVDTERTRRFGINSSELSVAEEMRRCGFGWVRFENAKWMMFCTAKDKYAFDGSVAPWHVNHDQIFSTYQKLGMKVLPYVFQPPKWAREVPAGVKKNEAGYPPKDNSDYGDAIFQLVARDGSATVDPSKLLTPDKKSGLKLIDAVELWNEPNLNDPGWGPFVGPITQYFEVMRAGAEGSRRADPSLPITSCGWAGIGLEVVGQMSQYKYADGKTPLDFVDIVNVHFYSGREEPEICGWDPNVDRDSAVKGGTTYPEQIEDLVSWRDQLKPKAEIWLTETGNDVGGPIGRSERYQAAKVPRTIMIALAMGVEKVFIYREKGSDPAQHAGAGLLRNDSSVRPVWLTTATLIRQLQGFNGKALRLPAADPKVWMFLWDDGKRKVVTAWRYEGTSKLGVDLGKANVSDSFSSVSAVGSTADLTITEFPIYIALTAPSAGFEKIVADAKAVARARTLEREELAKTPAYLFDFGPLNQRLGILKGYGLPRTYTLLNKDMVWDENKGYGFVNPAMNDDERHWIRDSLERDSCKVNPGNTFKFKLPAGKFRLKVSAEAINGKEGNITLKTAAGTEQKKVAGREHVVEFAVDGAAQVLEVGVPDYGNLNWISAVGEAK
ncbi:MAG: hypothetical protein A2X45_21180 [Lentisphaerae bacterium GWF2_50_93]|nr:MAG: hypothetical protein A2X45_21180 [Lentisphaerae bacterium GWF2_50_93]